MRRLLPSGPHHALRPALGGLLGLAFAGTVLGLLPGDSMLIGPLGASAVLIFAVPASPFAQPLSVIGGNVLSALAAMIIVRLMPLPDAMPVVVGACAVGAAMLAMALGRCLHPPGGGMALLIGLTPPDAHGWIFAVMPIAAGSALLVAAGLVYNRMTGHSYPHKPVALPPRAALTGYEPSDLDAVLDQADEMFDVSREDLDAIIRLIEARVAERAGRSQK